MSTAEGGGGRYNVALVHTIDPRGSKVGGIETFVRDYIQFHPDDMDLTLIGVDGFGDLELGRIHRVTVRGREIDFLPLTRVPDDEASIPRKGLLQTVLFQFAGALIRNRAMLRRMLRDGDYSLDLRRIELSFFPRLIGRPFVQMLHDGATKDKAMSSVLKHVWWVKELAERHALRHCTSFYCVNDELTQRLKRTFPRYAAKLDTLPTWANPDIFRPSPYRFGDTIDVVFAGRMDLFKRPDVMFDTIAEAARRDPAVRLHYIGDGDPAAFAEFAAIRDRVVLHGRKNSREIAGILADSHIGILTSDFEGMPRVVMETLQAGRPVVALHLPQLEKVIHEGVSGSLVPRGAESVRQHAEALLATYAAMRNGAITPEAVADAVSGFSAPVLLGRLYDDHRAMHGLARRACP